MSVPKQNPPGLDEVQELETQASNMRRIIEDRNRWFYELEEPRKQEKLFELEVLLKGLDRFFNLQNQPISEREGIVSRDFTNELRIIRNAVTRVVTLTRGLLSTEDKRALHFTNYVETRLLNDYQRAKRVERALEQKNPEQSLYVLCHAFINFQEIVQSVLVNPKNSYFLFYHLEMLISREIAGNRYFNPFKAAGFAPHYDVIKSPRFTKLVRSIKDPVVKKNLSIMFLLMFKLLAYLSFINPEAGGLEDLKNSLLIFALVHSEAMMLNDHLENELPRTIKASETLGAEVKGKVLDHFNALSYQLSRELEKIYELELKDAAVQKDLNALRIGVSRSRGLLTNIFQQGIVHIGMAFDPKLEGREVFPDFVSRVEQSLKLRRDIWLFHKVIENIEGVVETTIQTGVTIPLIEALKTLRNFIFYYQNISFQYVRSLDRDEFKLFFDKIDSFAVADVDNPDRLEDMATDLHTFKMFLETTLASINNRAELRDLPFGKEEGERILAQFLG